jgi:O-antigen/teichoic acid export membrane protein
MIRRSFAFAISDRAISTVVVFGSMAIISRILTPAEIGVFLVASSLVYLIEAFRDFGVAACIVQEKDLTQSFVQTAFTIMTLLSLALGAAIFFAAGWIAIFFDEPEMTLMIRIACLAFIAAPISNPLLALMRRDMAFGAVAWTNILSTVVNSGLSIGLALAGYGAFSLIWGSVGAAFIACVVALVARPDMWVFRLTLAEWRRVVPFGFWTTLVTILGMVFESFPRFILGRLLGFTAVGLFSRALSLSQLVEKTLLSAVQPVIMSDFAARFRSGEALSRRYLTGLEMVATLQWPAMACLAVLADPIVRLLLGSQWLEVIPILRIVAIAGMALFPASLTFPVLVAMGRIRDMAIVSLILFFISTSIIYAASQISLIAVAWSLLLVNPIQAIGMMLAVHRHVPLKGRDVAWLLWKCFVITSASAFVPLVLVTLQGPELGVVASCLAVAGAAVGWSMGLVVMSSPIISEVTRAWSYRPFGGKRSKVL